MVEANDVTSLAILWSAALQNTYYGKDAAWLRYANVNGCIGDEVATWLVENVDAALLNTAPTVLVAVTRNDVARARMPPALVVQGYMAHKNVDALVDLVKRDAFPAATCAVPPAIRIDSLPGGLSRFEMPIDARVQQLCVVANRAATPCLALDTFLLYHVLCKPSLTAIVLSTLASATHELLPHTTHYCRTAHTTADWSDVLRHTYSYAVSEALFGALAPRFADLFTRSDLSVPFLLAHREYWLLKRAFPEYSPMRAPPSAAVAVQWARAVATSVRTNASDETLLALVILSMAFEKIDYELLRARFAASASLRASLLTYVRTHGTHARTLEVLVPPSLVMTVRAFARGARCIDTSARIEAMRGFATLVEAACARTTPSENSP